MKCTNLNKTTFFQWWLFFPRQCEPWSQYFWSASHLQCLSSHLTLLFWIWHDKLYILCVLRIFSLLLLIENGSLFEGVTAWFNVDGLSLKTSLYLAENTRSSFCIKKCDRKSFSAWFPVWFHGLREHFPAKNILRSFLLVFAATGFFAHLQLLPGAQNPEKSMHPSSALFEGEINHFQSIKPVETRSEN